MLFERIAGFHRQSTRAITSQAACNLLGLPPGANFTPKKLRYAYFEAAKKCHPDSSINRDIHNKAKLRGENIDVAKQFRLLTEAFEMLQCINAGGSEQDISDSDWGITDEEEINFRRECQEWLGLKAEIVEESKRCPAFRQWLHGKTVAAFHWNVFFLKNGGLAPMLKREKPATLLAEGDKLSNPRRTRRAKR